MREKIFNKHKKYFRFRSGRFPLTLMQDCCYNTQSSDFFEKEIEKYFFLCKIEGR